MYVYVAAVVPVWTADTGVTNFVRFTRPVAIYVSQCGETMENYLHFHS